MIYWPPVAPIGSYTYAISFLMSLKSVLSLLSLLELAFAILSKINLLTLNDIVGGNILLLHVPEIGLNAHGVI
jgi:hypothetical protein